MNAISIEIITIPERLRGGFGFGSHLVCQSILESLSIENYQVKLTICENQSDLDSIVERRPDLVILAVKHILHDNGNIIWLSDFFEKAAISYTGSKQASMQYDVSKDIAKKQVRSYGIKTADFLTCSSSEYEKFKDFPLNYPLFLKPAAAADSHGIDIASLVHNSSQFERKLKSLYRISPKPILVEQYLQGREFTVAILEDGDALIIAPIEIIPPEENGVRILGEKTKSEDTEILKKVIDKETLAKLSELAINSFQALQARDFARIDIRMDGKQEYYFMEANLTPGMKKGSSYFPEAFKIHLNMNYDNVVKLFIKNAINRISRSPTVLIES